MLKKLSAIAAIVIGLSSISLPVSAAHPVVEAMAGVAAEDALNDPEVQKNIQEIERVFKKAKERMDQQKAMLIEASILWTKANPLLPKTMLELAAQSHKIYYQGCLRDTNKQYDRCKQLIDFIVNRYFDPGVLAFQTLADVKTSAQVIQWHRQFLFTPTNKLPSEKPNFLNYSLRDYFTLWSNYKYSADLTKEDYIVKNYHPISPSGVVVTAGISFANWEYAVNEYNKYEEEFLSDPMNKAKRLQPEPYSTWLPKHFKYEYVENKNLAQVQKQVGEKAYKQTIQAFIDYATGKTKTLNLPKEVKTLIKAK